MAFPAVVMNPAISTDDVRIAEIRGLISPEAVSRNLDLGESEAAFITQSRRQANDIIHRRDDETLARLMTNLGGHDMDTILEAFESAPNDRPCCFIAYTIKGHGLPFAGHKDNHSGLMNKSQMDAFRAQMGINQGEEWDPFAGLDMAPHTLRQFLDTVPFNARGRRKLTAAPVPTPDTLALTVKGQASTQSGFGRLLDDIAKAGGPLADRIVTTSPDVTVSTNLGPWVNRRGLFSMASREDVFKSRGLMSPQPLYLLSRHIVRDDDEGRAITTASCVTRHLARCVRLPRARGHGDHGDGAVCAHAVEQVCDAP